MADTALAIASVATGTGNIQGNIDVAQVTQQDQFGNPIQTLQRENVVIADPINFFGQAQTTLARGVMVDNQLIDLMRDVLIELRVITQFLGIGLNIQDDPALLRADPTIGV